MQKSILTALIVALLSGLAIGTQSSLKSAAGKITGATLTGLLVNFLGGAAAGLLLIVVYVRQGNATFSAIQVPTFRIIVVSGLLGIGIVAGIAYALPKIGIAAGLSTIIAIMLDSGIRRADVRATGRNLRAGAESMVRSVKHPFGNSKLPVWGEAPREHDGHCFCGNDQYPAYS